MPPIHGIRTFDQDRGGLGALARNFALAQVRGDIIA